MKRLLKEIEEKKILIEVKNGELSVFADKSLLNSSVIDEIRLRKKELIEFIIDRDANVLNKFNQLLIPIAPIKIKYPLSSGQKRIWILSQMGKGGVAYNIPGSFSIEGKLDYNAFRCSFIEIIKRHESLRTQFIMDGSGDVFQYIKPETEVNFELGISDLRNESNIWQQVNKFLYDNSIKQFDLSKDDLIRAEIYQVEDEKFIFSIVMHHIITDGKSMHALVRELSSFYNSYQSGTDKKLPPLRLQYKDYAVWQQGQISSGELEEHRKYWIEKFDGEIPMVELLTDFPRIDVEMSRSDIHSHLFEKRHFSKFKDLCHKNDSTLFIGLYSLINCLLFRLTGQNDIIIGTPVSGRENIELEDQIGLYINTIAVRLNFHAYDSFVELLEKVRKGILDGYEHQAYPFDELLNDIDVQWSINRNPLFDVMIEFQDLGDNFKRLYEFENCGIKICEYPQQLALGKFELTFRFIEEDDCLRLDLEYNKSIYSSDSIKRIATYLDKILAAIIENPSIILAEIDFIPEEQKEQLLFGFNDTQTLLQKGESIADLWNTQVLNRPDQSALIFREKSFTYDQLNAISNQLGKYLQKQYNIHPGEIIAIKLERSEWMIISILAIIKLGCAYLPIDPDFPMPRINYMIKDSECKAVIDERELIKFRDEQAQYSSSEIDIQHKSTDLLYIIYTSGSTGEPKGCMIENWSVINRIEWMWQKYKFNTEDIILQKTAYTFDVSVWEIFMPLCWGAKMVLCESEDTLSPIRIYDIIQRHGITCLHFVPSVLFIFINVLIENLNLINKLKSLEKVIASGEALSVKIVRTWYKYFDIPLINLYGPTEASIDVSYYDTSAGDTRIPIGKPIWNTKMYILDRENKLVPIGVQGEICISGIGLARGYLNKDELTEEKFIDNPFIIGEKMYKTGDLGKWLSNGNIEYLGRSDSQVKIRGFRVELGEIENALRNERDIEDAFVLIKQSDLDETEVIAFVLSKVALNVSDLRINLRRKLPSYMMPLHFIQMDKMPLTSNGKVDRKKLLELSKRYAIKDSEYVAPRNIIEEKLVEIWKELLGKEIISIHDNFIELGGHSLKIMKLSGRIYKQFGVEVNLQNLFGCKNLEEQAMQIQAGKNVNKANISRIVDQHPSALSFSQHRLWTICQFKDASIAYNIPSAYIFEGEFDPLALQSCIDVLINRYEILRTVFDDFDDKEVRQRVLSLEDLGFKITLKDFRHLDHDYPVLDDLIITENRRVFDLRKGPLLRASLYRLMDSQWLFSFVIHHIISDAWSMKILMKELIDLYNNPFSIKEGEKYGFPGIQYKDYSAWQRRNLTSEEMRRHGDYWRERFSGNLQYLDLPKDFTRPFTKSFNGNAIHFRLGSEITTDLKMMCFKKGGTLFMGLLACINTLFYKYTGQEDIILGIPVAGRDHIDLEDQVGCFLNTIALRSRFSGHESFTDLLDNVRKNILEALEHQIYPLDEILASFDNKRDLNKEPLFNVLVDFHDNEEEDFKMLFNGISAKPFEMPDHSVSKFDLTFIFTESLENGLSILCEYNTDLFKQDTINRLFLHLDQIIKSILEKPTKSLDSLEYLVQIERHQLLHEFNELIQIDSSKKSVLDLFGMQVQNHPNKVALTFNNNVLTYKQLDDQSNQLANYLKIEFGIQPEELVGIMLDRSERMIIAILGILKSGGAYVPIDPNYPEQRKKYILDHTRLKLIVSESHILLGLDLKVRDVISIDISSVTSLYSVDFIDYNISSGNLAYVIYTSGSTGNPKGCSITHGNLFNYIEWANQFYFNESWEINFALFTTLSFDLTVTSIFCPLTSGGKISIYGQDNISEIFLKIFNESSSVNIIKMTPSHIGILKELDIKSDSIKCIILGGEEVKKEQLLILNGINSFCKIYNEYGPTETTVGCVVEELKLEQNILIGKPIRGVTIYILDKANQLCAIGVPGEIYIAGAGVGRGYLNESLLTAERFIKNPFTDTYPFMYKTGDLARWTSDGNVEYLGRNDEQVKINGYRIELGELENVLQTQPYIIASAVVPIQNPKGGKELIAYLVGKEPLNVYEIRNMLSSQLPDYMLPRRIVQVKEIPLTINGKTDKKLLLNSEGVMMRSLGEEYVIPGNETEEKLASIWSEILQLDKIGVNDNFFALGGDSLKALTFIITVKKRLESEISVDDLYELQTIHRLSNYILNKKGNIGLNLFPNDKEKGLAEIKKIKELAESEDANRQLLPEEYEDIYPLVRIEEGMIYSSMLNPQEPIYYDQFTYSIQIEDLEIFKSALKNLVQKHDMLRTKYYMISFSKPVKVILCDLIVPLSFEDLTGLSVQGKVDAVHNYIKEDLSKRLTFDNELLWRVKIFKTSSKNYYVTYSFHHALLDGWSVSVLQTELSNFGKEVTGKLKHNYRDYCALELGKSRHKEVESYWIDVLKGFTRNKLPFNYRGIKLYKMNGMKTIRKPIENELLFRLDKLVATYNISFKTICVAAHVYLLHILCSENDIVTGVVTHDRPEIEDSEFILGCFLNTVPVRINVERSPDILSFLNEINTTLKDIKRNGIHLEDIADMIGEKTSASNPIFDTILNYTDFYVFKNLSADLYSASMNSDMEVSHEMTNTLFDVEVDRTLNNLLLRIKYAAGYFTESDVQYALELYVRILNWFVLDIYSPLASLELLTDQEKKEILIEFNDTKTPYSNNKTISQLFEQRVFNFPDAVALRQDGKEVSYHSLNERSNQLANYLIKKGVKPGENIGIIVSRSFDMIIAMCGTLKAAGAYVPIDPDYPMDRQRYILKNSQITRVLVDSNYPVIEDARDFEILLLNDERIISCNRDNPDLKIDSRQLAYTIYTSGTTGTPKGVMIEHHSAVNLIEWVNKEFKISHEDRLLFVTSMCFDLSVYDIFGALAAGATLVIARQHEIQDVRKLKKLLIDEDISFWDSVPTTMNYLIGELDASNEKYMQNCLRLVFLSGDWIPVLLPSRINKYFPKAKIISLGGATEGTVWSNYYSIDNVDESWASIPYGKPISNNLFYVLNPQKRPVPIGTPGELYIGGVGVARGYANDAQKTEYSFMPDPFNHQLGGRMYRTGDLGRITRDGNMEFLGRRDNQVKIRGFRVELGEIESILIRHKNIKEAAVEMYTDKGGNNQLCAYLVLNDEFEKQSIIEKLRQSLPSYMIPNQYIYLPFLPLNSNGKINRKALPLLLETAEHSNTEYSPPTSELEINIERIWKSILHLERLSVNDDLFEIGANSLSVGSFVNRIQREMQVSVSIRDIFLNPTVKGIAVVLEGKNILHKSIMVVENQASYILSSQQKELWVSSQFNDVNIAFNMPGIYEFEGELQVNALQEAIINVINRHEILRTVFRENQSGDVRQFVISGEKLDFRIHFEDLRDQPDKNEILKKVAREEFIKPFDLKKWPMMKTSLFQIEDNKWVLIYLMHHIIADGWSMGILMDEVLAFYNSFIDNEPLKLTDLRIQYKDYAAWQQKELNSIEIQFHKEYWMKQFEEPPSELTLPQSKGGSINKTYRGGLQRMKFGKQLSREFKAVILAAKPTGTLFKGLFAIVDILLYKYTGFTDVVLGTSFSGRDHSDLENQIGYYLNTIALRSKFQPEYNFFDMLQMAGNVVVEAHEHQVFPLEDLLESLQSKGEYLQDKLFNYFIVMRDLQYNNSVPVKPKNCSIREVEEMEWQASKFDLTFIFNEIEDEVFLDIEYNSVLFDTTGIRKILDSVVELMKNIVKNPLKPIKHMNYLTHDERFSILGDYQNERIEFSNARTFLEIFKEKIELSSGELVKISENKQLSYEKLDVQSDLFGNYLLQNYNINISDLVAIHIENELLRIVAIIGLLKIGITYLIIEPGYSFQEMRDIVNDSNCSFLIDESAMMNFSCENDQYINKNTVQTASPSDIQYILYNPGSLPGKRKLEIKRGTLLSYLTWNLCDSDGSGETDNLFQNGLQESIESLFQKLSNYFPDSSISHKLTPSTSFYSEIDTEF